jgi:hypothetical protein
LRVLRDAHVSPDHAALDADSAADRIGDAGELHQQNVAARLEAIPSPVVFTMRPRCITSVGSTSSRRWALSEFSALCEPGGLCISRSANEQIRDKPSLPLADLGEQTVKNIARSIGVFGLGALDMAGLAVA